MDDESTRATDIPAPGADPGLEQLQIDQNIAAVHEFTEREARKIGRSQRLLEQISQFIGRPRFFGLILLFYLSWILVNLAMQQSGGIVFDAPPFLWLQGLVGLGALLTSTVVLSKQTRLARLAEQRAHLDLKVTLLTEQKVAKLIDLLEELRRDLPNVKDRHDSGSAVLQQAMSPEGVLAALDECPVADPPKGGVAPALAAATPASIPDVFSR